MDFENEGQRHAACHTLMNIAKRPDLWLPSGPTKETVRLRDTDASVLSPGERVMLLVTFSFFEGDETLRFSELARLSPENLFGVGSLLASLAVDRMQPPGALRRTVAEWIAEERQLIG